MTLGEIYDELKALAKAEKSLAVFDYKYKDEDAAWQFTARYQERRQKLVQRIEDMRKKEIK